MSDAVFLVLATLIGVIAGIAIGILFAGLRSDKSHSPAQPKSQPNMTETARIWQDRKSGNLYPEVSGALIRSPADLSDAQRDRLIAQLHFLLVWLNPGQETIETPASAPETPPVLQPFQQNLTPVAPLPQTGKLNPIDLVARAIQPEVRPTAPEKSMIMQIDEILQEKLNDTPLAGKGIRLVEHPTHGLMVMVGLNRYEGVEEVPDPDIRALIRQSVADWENRATQS